MLDDGVSAFISFRFIWHPILIMEWSKSVLVPFYLLLILARHIFGLETLKIKRVRFRHRRRGRTRDGCVGRVPFGWFATSDDVYPVFTRLKCAYPRCGCPTRMTLKRSGLRFASEQQQKKLISLIWRILLVLSVYLSLLSALMCSIASQCTRLCVYFHWRYVVVDVEFEFNFRVFCACRASSRSN